MITVDLRRFIAVFRHIIVSRFNAVHLCSSAQYQSWLWRHVTNETRHSSLMHDLDRTAAENEAGSCELCKSFVVRLITQARITRATAQLASRLHHSTTHGSPAGRPSWCPVARSPAAVAYLRYMITQSPPRRLGTAPSSVWSGAVVIHQQHFCNINTILWTLLDGNDIVVHKEFHRLLLSLAFNRIKANLYLKMSQ